MSGEFPADTRRIITERAQGMCEVCGRASLAHVHHRQLRSQGGQGTVQNGLSTCHDCHTTIHREPRDAMANGWIVASHDDPADVPVVVETWFGRATVILLDDGCYQQSLFS